MCPHPTPLTVYENPADPQDFISTYIGVSGCIGDVPFTAMMAGACGHTGCKGCKNCFLLGRTTSASGKPLKPPRFCSYCQNIADAIAELVTADAGWQEVDNISFTGQDGKFDEATLNQLRVTPELQSILVQTAEDIREDVRQKRPLPPKPDNAPLGSARLAQWQEGMIHIQSLWPCWAIGGHVAHDVSNVTSWGYAMQHVW